MTSVTNSAFHEHDHDRCAATALALAEAHCAENKLRFTDIRRRVLCILLESHQALGAYDVLDRLSADGRAAQPPLAYRALEFLVEHGFVHKVEGMNAFTACTHFGSRHDAMLLICRDCKRVAEAEISRETTGINGFADALNFAIERSVIEVVGLCPACQAQPSSVS